MTDKPPKEPICRSAEDARQPCRFATVCHESRQRIAHYSSPSLRGKDCWAFQRLVSREGSDAQLERRAIQDEGRA